MRETVDFRVPETNAQGNLPDDAGERLGDTVRRILVATDDPLLAEIRRLDREFRARGDVFFTGWIRRRQYSRRELEQAELLHVLPKKVFEPAGEECGTVYDDARGCPVCGGGAPQVTSLYLDGRRIPRNLDFAQTIAGEIVVSSRVVSLFRENDVQGATFDPVRISNQNGMQSEEYFQLRIIGSPVQLDSSTRAGGSLFDESGYGRCPRGDVVGLNLLSEVTVQRRSLPDSDVMVTAEMAGVRRGLLRPRPILLISPKARRVIEDHKLKGLISEVAYLA